MNRRLLEAPFAPSQIKQRKGPTGGVLDYVEGHTVIARLNQILKGPGPSRCRGTRSGRPRCWTSAASPPRGSSRPSFGASTVMRDRGTKALVSLGQRPRVPPPRLESLRVPNVLPDPTSPPKLDRRDPEIGAASDQLRGPRRTAAAPCSPR